MKTNITLKSSDRNLFGVTIRQETSNQFLCVSDLQVSYDRVRFEKGWSGKHVNDVLLNDSSAERLFYVLDGQHLIKTTFSEFINEVKQTSLTKVLKKYGVYKTSGARENRVVYCNPYIWVMLAMELNPEIYGTVIVWLGDNLILNRIEAGDRYNDLCRAAAKFPDVDYRSIAKAVNYIIFNVHETMIRNKATQSQLKEMDLLQNSLATMVNMGFITSFEMLVNTMRRMYVEKWGTPTVK